MLLRTQSSGLALYEGAPDLPPTPRSPPQSDSPPHSPTPPQCRYGNTEWCSCNNCGILENGTEGECICCREMGTALTRVQPAGCITEHPEFSMLCLNIPVLRLLYFELRGLGYPMHDDIHRRYRYTAYRVFVRWLWRRLGKGNRMILPACVVCRIREEFPSEITTDFKYPRY
ncbi:P2X purinoceptor 7-like [Ixodes scapularis]|uniref:P2X purinoceptor 7-like n=1 Tax=Ixodes scapularis TaxID=6945 RepID=UPI001A9D5C43|nr:P2X purinoceptor 7-like [Ixodes scapularis]